MIGKNIWYHRISQGLSLDDVSSKSGVPARVIREFEEANITHIPNTDLAAIAKAFVFKNAMSYLDFLRLNGYERKFRLYTLGLPKTGTVSLSALFGKYHSGHEFWQWDTNQKWIAWKEHTISRSALRDFLVYRDAAACLEMDSAFFHLNYFEILAAEYPDAKFICLVREPRSWVRSQVNYFMDLTKEALQADRIDNGFPFDLPRGDRQSREKYLAGLDRHIEVAFQTWTRAYRRILEHARLLSPERFCFIMTGMISQSLGIISQIAGIAKSNLIIEHSHSNRADYTTDILELVRPGLMDDYFKRHCRELFEELEAMSVINPEP